MSPQTIQLRLGIGAILLALVLGFVAIPYWVSSPSNVSNIVLAPTFWPYVLTALMGMSGVGLLMASRVAPQVFEDGNDDTRSEGAWLRLAILGAIMIVTMFALPRFGMVWSCVIIFALTAFLFRTRHPKTALVCAVIIPLALYAFFAHVAGVAIPQGNFVRLP